MSVKINNFINLGGAGDGSESLPVYGIYWHFHNRLCVFEIDDITNPYKEIDMIIKEDEPEFKNIIFDGRFDANVYEYLDNNTNISLDNPYINILDINEDGLRDSIDLIIYDDGDESVTKICETLSINKGFVIGCQIGDSYINNFMFIVSPGSLVSDTYDGFGVSSSRLISNA